VRVRALIVAVLCVGVTAGCSSAPSRTPTGTVDVVAAENVWGDVVRQIGGNHVRVTSILDDPAADPHLYESNARDAAAIGRAGLVILNGVGYDDAVRKLFSGAGSSARVVTVADVLRIQGKDSNPHLWYDIPRLATVADAIADALSTLSPGHEAEFDANAVRFVSSLRPLLDTLATIRQKYAGAPVAYTERVAGYLLADAGLDDRTPPGFAQSIEDGSEPTPHDTQALEDLIRHRQVRALLYNAQATSTTTRGVEALARDAHVAVVAVTETMPKNAANFQAWQLDQERALLAALGG
jgi:zinc/manganese transport system substrate-binding protein